MTFKKRGEIMSKYAHRRINKQCVSVRAYEEEQEYYSFSDNYDYGDEIMEMIMTSFHFH